MNPKTVIIPLQPASFPAEAAEMLDAFRITIQDFMHFIIENFTVWECDSDLRCSRIEWFLRHKNDGQAAMDYPTPNGWYSWHTTVIVLEEFALEVKRQMDPYLIELDTQGNRWSYINLIRTIGPDIMIRITPPLMTTMANFHHA